MLCTFCAKLGAQRPTQNVHSVWRPAEARRGVSSCFRLLCVQLIGSAEAQNIHAKRKYEQQ
ncbi:hypothetical protein FIU95_12545 [Microbulbifer sp. THAF38]|nr:hypothetical protein FIU95_12545 [Microbulbifer sp. THAF38]